MSRIRLSIVLRSAAFVAVLLGVNVYVSWMIYRNHLLTDGAPKEAKIFVAEIENLRADLELVPPNQRNEWFRRFNSHPDVTIEQLPAGSAMHYGPQPNRYMQIFESDLRAGAGQDIRITVVHDPAYLLKIDFDASGGRYRLSIPVLGIGATEIWSAASVLICNGFIIAAVIVFVVRQINRPLRRAAAALGGNDDQLAEIDMPVSAPEEFQVFANRFNVLARRLRAQERERSLVLAGVSHDLRAPLTRIRVNAEIIDEDDPGKAARIVRDSDSMRHIIDQFIDHQRGVNPDLATRVNLRAAAGEVVNSYRDTGTDVHLTAPVAATIIADPIAVERILSNLIDNANAHGKPPIEVKIVAEAVVAKLIVEDNGPGIIESEMGRLIKPFERLDDARSVIGHCGLGLAIVDRLARQLGGSLNLENRQPSGLRVTISLPLAPAAQAKPMAARDPIADGDQHCAET